MFIKCLSHTKEMIFKWKIYIHHFINTYIWNHLEHHQLFHIIPIYLPKLSKTQINIYIYILYKHYWKQKTLKKQQLINLVQMSLLLTTGPPPEDVAGWNVLRSWPFPASALDVRPRSGMPLQTFRWKRIVHEAARRSVRCGFHSIHGAVWIRPRPLAFQHISGM